MKLKCSWDYMRIVHAGVQHCIVLNSMYAFGWGAKWPPANNLNRSPSTPRKQCQVQSV